MQTRLHPSIRMTAAAAVAALLGSGIAMAIQMTPAQAAPPAPLPATRLEFGLASDPTQLGWMTTSGVPWKYRYQYLSAGVNTGFGWETWNTPTGAFATLYMNASLTAGYIPVFSYYELLQSNPSLGANEQARDFSNLNNTTTMAAYYANFKLLMQKAGAFGHPVVVHVEPDLWGYLQQLAGSGDASTLTASVASSAFSDAAGIPNSAQGFGWALLHIRDLYAPNAILAIHASPWSAGADIASDTNPGLNVVALADSTAAFLNSAGILSNLHASTWDVVFNDLDDHDAGWWELNGGHHWWDPTNTTYPNFARYLAWVTELNAKTSRQQVAWQVPVGNQYFLTMNNTCSHYQDNVAPYFIAHPSALSSAGLVAVLFGKANACQTTFVDFGTKDLGGPLGDGITNNGGVPTTDLAGGCNACNTHVSTFADDDGGYLRIFVGQYYAGGGPSRSSVAQSGANPPGNRTVNPSGHASVGTRIPSAPPAASPPARAATATGPAQAELWLRIGLVIRQVEAALRLIV